MWYDECLSTHFRTTRSLCADMEDEQLVADLDEDFDGETLRLVSGSLYFPGKRRDFSPEE